MNANALPVQRFVRRTQLSPNEYRKNFRQVDSDAISAVTSPEACLVTPLMSKIYLRLINAPSDCFERQGVLRFEGRVRQGSHLTAWKELCQLLGVASATARKALVWMHNQGIIGYFAGRNGVGIRIFLNRASSSIGNRGGQKILEFSRASGEGGRASAGEAAFNDSYADLEVRDESINPRAPEGAAGQVEGVKNHPHPARPGRRGQGVGSEQASPRQTAPRSEQAPPRAGVEVGELVWRLRRELEPTLRAEARRAAAEEHERTREWLESRGLPKAARVAQKEAFDVLRRHGLFRERARPSNAEVGLVRPSEESGPLSDGEVEEFAGACVAMLEVKGQPVGLTLAQMNADAGGFLPPADAARVRARVEAILGERC